MSLRGVIDIDIIRWSSITECVKCNHVSTVTYRDLKCRNKKVFVSCSKCDYNTEIAYVPRVVRVYLGLEV
jgi:transcription elongation factor Elf1